jgi:hypothetical protein
MMGSIKRSSLAAGVCSTLVLLAGSARADEPPVGLSVSIERVAGVAYASLRPTSSDTTYGATTFGIAGPAINPIALPRVGVDALLPVGITLGGAIGYGHASLSLSPDSGSGQTVSGNAWLLSPRIGYLVHLGPLFDLWPRAGVTLASASVQEPDGQRCISNFNSGTGTSNTTCTTTAGASDSLFVVAASVELAGALRLTRSFNLLGGIAYDHVFSASGSASPASSNGGSSSTDLQAQGKYLGAQLWFGLGGYVL